MKKNIVLNRICPQVRWERLFAFGVLGFLVSCLIGRIVPLRWNDLYKVYGPTLICALAGAYFAKNGLKACLEVKLYLAYTAWLLVSRWINRDFYLFVDFRQLINAVTFFIFLVSCTVLSGEDRRAFFDIICFVYIGFYLAVALIGIFIFLTDTYLHIPPENIWFTIFRDELLLSLNALSVGRLSTALRTLTAMGLVMYQFFRRRAVIPRVLLMMCLLAFIAVLGLCHGRTAFISASCCFVMFVLLLLIPRFGNRGALFRLAILPAAAVISLLLFYKSFDVSNNIIISLRTVTVPAFEDFYSRHDAWFDEEHFGTRHMSAIMNAGANLPKSTEVKAAGKPESTAAASIADTRKLIGNWTLTGRTDIWRAGFISLRQRPLTLLTGALSNDIVPEVNRIIHLYIFPTDKAYILHMHSSFMQVLMMTGLPGLLLFLGFFASLVFRMLKIYFSGADTVPSYLKALTIPITGAIIASFAEPILFYLSNESTYTVFLCMGFFLAEYGELTEAGQPGREV